MSSNSANTSVMGNRYTKKRTTTGGGKFCKICKDTGKTEEEYTSHYVRESRDPNSRTVCPTLIATVCRYCREGGHTVSRCDKLKSKKNAEQQHIITKNYCQPVTKVTATVKSNVKSNPFSGLMDSDSEDETEEVVTKEVITKEVVTKETPTNQSISYASVLSAPPPPPVRTGKPASQISSLIPTTLDFSVEASRTDADDDDVVVALFDLSGNWADDDDDDDSHVTLMRPTDDGKLSDVVDYFTHYARRMDSIVSAHTLGYTKLDTLTESAMMYLANKWDTEYFADMPSTAARTANMNPTTRHSSRILYIINRYSSK